VHDRAQAIAVVEEAAQAFDTFNLDIMYALPGQTLENQQYMRQALSLAPPHISIYHLTIELNTYFAKFPPGDPEGRHGHAMLDQITEMTQQASSAKCRLMPAPPLFSQHQLLAIRRLPGITARTAVSVLRTGWFAKCVTASRSLLT
jgi:hypothetical protein